MITAYKYDDHDTRTDKGGVTADVVMAAGECFDFDRVYLTVEGGEWTQIHCGIHQNYFFTGYRTEADAKRLMTPDAFAKYFPSTAAAERAEAEEAHRIALVALRVDDAEKLASMTTDEPQPVFQIGQRIVSIFASLNKNCHIAEYLRECAKPENGEKYWSTEKWQQSKNWYQTNCKVEKILTLTPAEYDDLATGLLDDHPEWFGNGGTNSDYDPGREVKEFRQLTRDEQEKWQAESYNLVTVIQAEGRKSFVVDAQGYNYARYVGLDPVVQAVKASYTDGKLELVFN
ncbi:MAG: hypothetical protein P4L87_01605 [Formivibrio sp.]|nr:hypothetical protein [Formivibrio sp.]